jgi:hypothetical protein
MQADSALMAAATGGVWTDFAPIGTVPPFALIGQQAGTDVLTVNANRLFVHLLMRLQAVGPVANYAALVTIADRIDALFKNVRSLGLPSGGVLACYREQTLAYSNLINGAQWSYLGGLYHIELQGS